MDDQALVEGSVVFKDEDDPTEKSPISYQSRVWCLGSGRVTAHPKTGFKKIGPKAEASFLLIVSVLAQSRHFLLVS